MIAEGVVLVDGKVWRDDDGDGEGSAQLNRQSAWSILKLQFGDFHVLLTHLTDMAVRIMKLNAKLQLMPDLNSPCVRVLQAPAQGVRHVQATCKLISLRRLVNDFHAILIQCVFVGQYRPCDFVRVVRVLRVVGFLGVEGEVLAFDEL